MDDRSHTCFCLNCKLIGLCLPFGLQEPAIKRLTSIIKTKRPLQAGEFLYLQSDPCQSLYAIKSGSFRSFITNADGVEQIIGFYLPGQLMGLDALQHDRFTCSTAALETAAVCELPLNRLNELCSKIPELQTQMTRMFSQEIATDHDKIILLGHRSAKERIATFLLMLSHRFDVLGFSSTEFYLSMRREDIANFLGLTIETVSRQLAELGKHGVITIRRRDVQINDLALLKAIVNRCLPLPM